MALTPRVERFCREYVKTGVAGQAYRNAGYTSRGDSMYSCASRLLGVAKVKDRIKVLEKQAIKASDLTKERVLGMALTIYEMALEDRNLSVAGQQGERMAKMSGLWVDKTENVKTPDADILKGTEKEFIELFGEAHAKELMKAVSAKLGHEKPLPEATDEAPEAIQ